MKITSIMENDNLHIFDSYISGKLSETARKNFENSLESDIELKSEFEEYLHIINGIREFEHERLKIVMKDHKSKVLHSSNWKSIRNVAAAAAIILVLVIPGYVIFRTTTFPTRLVKEFYIEDPGIPVTMGASSNPLLEQAMIDYKDKQFEKSLLIISQLLATFPENDTLNYYAGLCNFELGKTEPAIENLEKLAEIGSVYYYPAKYNLGLLYIKNQDIPKARQMFELVSDGDKGTLKEKACELLERL